jgi:EmrB/QacA subfamily drug resistance transporter
VRSGAEPAPRRAREVFQFMRLFRLERPQIIALIVACALFMENFDGTVLATALPQIARSFGTDPVQLSLAITAYLLSVAIFIPASGWIADRLGARTVFRAAIAVFAIGSLLCGFSNSLIELTGARILQGIGGAMMVPVGRLVLLRNVKKSEMIRTMSYLTVPGMLGPVLGPLVGGFLVTYWSWRWIFFINVPIAILGLILVTTMIEEQPETNVPRLDLVGLALSGLALAGTMLGFVTLGHDAIPPLVSGGALVAGLALGVLYLLHAARHPEPILDVMLFRLPTFSITVGAGFLFRAGVGAMPFLLPLMFQVGFGMTAFAAGFLSFASAVGSIFMKAGARHMLRYFGFRTITTGNAVICGLFYLVYAAFTPSTPVVIIFILLLVGGLFRSLQFTAIQTLAFADITMPRMSRATTLSATCQQLAVCAGVAFGAMLLHLTLWWRGTSVLAAVDFWPSLLLIAFTTGLSGWFFAGLPRDAGAELSGHAPRRRDPLQPLSADLPRRAEGE